MPGIRWRFGTVAGGLAVWVGLIGVGRAATAAEDEADGWIELSSSLDRDVWRTGPGAWFVAGDAKIDPTNPRRLVGAPGQGVLINGPIGRTGNLLTRQEFGDLEFHCEFMIPRGSNSGVKFEGLYEVQIFDSYGKIGELKGDDMGGVYPKATLTPRYHHLDDGIAPRLNASAPPGTWQTLDVVFQAPRHDAEGKKIANAKLVKVVLNGQVIHEDLELKYPTGHAYMRPEPARGPILIQADHGPCAFRAMRVRPLDGSRTAAN